MMKNQLMVKLFLSLFLCTMVIFSSSYFGPKAFGVFKKANVQPIASVKEKANSATQPVAVDQDVVLNSATVNVKEIPEDLQTFCSTNPKIDIPAESSFSLLAFLKKQKLETLSGDTLSMIGTGIYQVVLPTNFSIEERNTSNEPTAFAALGDEAKVDLAQNMDLAFSNPNKTKYTLELQLNGNSLTVSLKGIKLPYEYKITKKNEQKLTPGTVVQYSPLLTPGQTALKSPGRSGQTIEVYRQTYKGDILINSELISNDYYPAQYRVEIHALDSSTQQVGASTDTTITSNQQTTTASTDQNSQTTQSATDGTTTTADNATSNRTSDSNLWGKPNEALK